MPSYSPERRTARRALPAPARTARTTPACCARSRKPASRSTCVAGHGVGAASAALAAIDGGARLWDADGVWRGAAARELLRLDARRCAAPAGSRGAAGTLVLRRCCCWSLGLVVYPLGFLLEICRQRLGTSLVAAYPAWLQTAFAGRVCRPSCRGWR